MLSGTEKSKTLKYSIEKGTFQRWCSGAFSQGVPFPSFSFVSDGQVEDDRYPEENQQSSRRSMEEQFLR